MTLSASAYCTVADVQALTPRYGIYTPATRPTLAQVERWIDTCSAQLNVMLAKAGFSAPLTQVDAKLACGDVVVSAVVDLCHEANSAGRFASDRALASSKSSKMVIRAEMAAWVEDMAAGLEAMGATRTQSVLGGVAFNEFDDSGRTIEPIFHRGAFGNTITDSGEGEE